MDGRFVVTFKGHMYLHINGMFISKDDGLRYEYENIGEIFVISPINYNMIAMGINRWNITWCYKNTVYQKQEFPF